MPLADLLVDAFFGRSAVPDVLEVALLRGGKEVSVPGYRRQQIRKGEWAVRGTTATREVSWAGFGQPVEFDATALMRGDEAIQVWQELSAAQIPVGMGYKATITADLAKV